MYFRNVWSVVDVAKKGGLLRRRFRFSCVGGVPVVAVYVAAAGEVLERRGNNIVVGGKGGKALDSVSLG